MYIPQKKPYYPLFEKSFETEQIFAVVGSRQVFVEGVLFQTTSTKAYMEPSMTKIGPVLKLFSHNG